MCWPLIAWSTPRSDVSVMATKSHRGANNGAASPQPGQERQDYTQTGDLDVNLYYSIFVDSVYVYFVLHYIQLRMKIPKEMAQYSCHYQ